MMYAKRIIKSPYIVCTARSSLAFWEAFRLEDVERKYGRYLDG